MVAKRQELLHQTRLEQQRAQLARGLVDFDALDLARQARVVGRAVVAREVRADAVAQVDALADVDRQVVHAVEAVHARAFRKPFEGIRRQLWRQAGDLEQALRRRGNLVDVTLAIEHLHEAPDRARVAQRRVTPRARGRFRGNRIVKSVACNERVEPVADRLGIEPAREAHGAQHIRGKGDAGAAELVLEESIVEARVVGDEDAALEALEHLAAQLGEGRLAAHHRVGDPRECLDLLGDAAFGVHQRRPLVDEFAVVDAHDADFRDAIARRGRSGSL